MLLDILATQYRTLAGENIFKNLLFHQFHSLLSMLIPECWNYFVKPSLWPLHPWDFLSYLCVILQILDIFFEPYVVLDKSRSYSPEIWQSCTTCNQRILCLLFNSAQFHHYETAMTPLSEMCDWAFSSALGHTLCKPSLCFSHHQ